MIFSLIFFTMTLEEILNIDWAEQKDLTKYVKHFEDAQLLNAQLTEFTYRYLRAKLIRWDEIVEEGIQNFNFFNFAVSYLRMRDYTCYKVIYPSCKVLDTYTELVDKDISSSFMIIDGVLKS